MGCMFTKAELENVNSRVFHVWNVDDLGRHVNPGKIEVTEVDLILRQKGKTPIHWPLRSLRRYGFDAELFSFESGRRCPTGPGIYAFKCRRAEALFNVLQECIQNSGGGGGGGAGATATSSGLDEIHLNTTSVAANITSNGVIGSSVNSNPSSAVDPDGYLEPISAIGGSNSCPIIGSNPQAGNNSLNGFVGFPASSNAADAGTSVQTDCCICNHNANSHYVNERIFSNSVSPDMALANHGANHQYVNSSVITENSHKSTHNNCLSKGNSIGINSSLGTTSSDSIFPSTQLSCPPGNRCLQCMSCVDLNTNYAKLDDLLKQEHSVKQHFYVNVKPEKSNNTSVNKNVTNTNCQIIGNATVTSPSATQLKAPVVHFYANLTSPSMPTGAPDSTDAMSEIQQVNYIVLDLDHPSDNKEQVMSPFSSNSITFPPDSPQRAPEGYATIDFDKTAALSNSSNPYLCNDDSVRKTRHNGTISLS